MSLSSLPEVPELFAHHDWRPDWTLDRPCLYWYVTFDLDAAIIRRAEELAPQLHRLSWVNRVPTDWLHLTLQEVGYVDEVDADEVTRIAEAARQVQDLLPLTVELGAVTTMTDAIVLPAVLSPALEEAHALLTASIGDRVQERHDDDPFWPHVTIGYLREPGHRDDVMAAFADAPSDPIQVVVPRLTLAAVTRLDTHYRWDRVVSLEENATS